MPLYEYRCKECGEAFEMMRRFSEADLTPACPKCESPKTEKRLSKVAAFGIYLSGVIINDRVSFCGQVVYQ
jgi:putative FmdB family regulatory protein